MRTFQIEIWRILKYLDGHGLIIDNTKLIKEKLNEFNKIQDNGTVLSLKEDNVHKK